MGTEKLMFQPIRVFQIWKDVFFVEQAESTSSDAKYSVWYIRVRRTCCLIIFTKILSCTTKFNSPYIRINTRKYRKVFIAFCRHTGKIVNFEIGDQRVSHVNINLK
jgi:hypothetical protein